MANSGIKGTKLDAFYAIGDKVWKGGSDYRRPGVVVAYFPGLDSQSMLHYVVAHKLKRDGRYSYHIYTSHQLTRRMQPDEKHDHR